jgi:hypothetical protein
LLGWVRKLLNLFISSSSKWWQILQFCFLRSFGLRVWKKGGGKKKVITFLLGFQVKWWGGVCNSFQKMWLWFIWNLSYFVFAHESLPRYKAQQYVIRFSLQFKSMMKVLAKFFPAKFDSYMEIFFFETYSSRIYLQAQNCFHIFFLLLDSTKTKEWFLE